MLLCVMKNNPIQKDPIPGTREDRRTGQYFPTLNGRDISPSSFDQARALEIAQKAAEKNNEEK